MQEKLDFQSHSKCFKMSSWVSRELIHLLWVLKTLPNTLDNILGPIEGLWKIAKIWIFLRSRPLLPAVRENAKMSTFWGVPPFYGRVESQRVGITSEYCWKCVQLPLIDLRIQYGTLKWHSLALFEKSLKNMERSCFRG